jgi:hypothetical protein
MTSAVKFLDENGSLAASRLQPDQVLDALTAGKNKFLEPLTHA